MIVKKEVSLTLSFACFLAFWYDLYAIIFKYEVFSFWWSIMVVSSIFALIGIFGNYYVYKLKVELEEKYGELNG